jgi:hypothetical protein
MCVAGGCGFSDVEEEGAAENSSNMQYAQVYTAQVYSTGSN